MTDNAITPPPELVRQWLTEGHHQDYCSQTEHAITQAARWGADQELEGCCAWLPESWGLRSELRAARRPKPPSLKEQALEELSLISISPESGVRVSALDTIRRALEQLDD